MEPIGVRLLVNRLLPAGYATSAYFLVAQGIAAGTVVLNDGFGRGDLAAFALWTGLSAPGFFLTSLLFRRWSRGHSATLAVLGANLLGGAFGVAWTTLVSVVMGPWVMAFSFPIGIAWVASATAGLLILGTLGRRMGAWLGATASWLITTAAVVLAIQLLSAKPRPDLVVTLADSAAEWHVQAVWDLTNPPPTSTPDGYNPAHVRSVARQDRDGLRRLRISFHPGGDEVAQAALVNRLRNSPLVKSVQEVGPDH